MDQTNPPSAADRLSRLLPYLLLGLVALLVAVGVATGIKDPDGIYAIMDPNGLAVDPDGIFWDPPGVKDPTDI